MTRLEGKMLDNEVVLISGGTQGVGRGIAEAASAAGATVVVTGRRLETGEATVAATIETYGRIDCLVNSAGVTSRGTLEDTTPELLDQHYAVNLRAPFFLMQSAVADMKQRQSPGTIVNIITMSSHGGQPYLAPYVASKSGLVGLTRNVANAHRWDKIRINGLNIGWTETEGEDLVQRTFHEADDTWLEKANASQPMGKLGQVDEIAEFVVFLLSERSGVVTGSIIDWDQIVVGAFD